MNEWLSRSGKRMLSAVMSAALFVSGNAGILDAEAAAIPKSEQTWEYSEKHSAATFAGKLPSLPGKVQIDGATYDVAWPEVEEGAFAGEYSTVTVNGSVTGANKEIQALVEVVPEDLVYFVNCGADAGVNPGNNNAATNVSSAPYQAVKELMTEANTPLKNTQADQIYATGNNWGLSVNGTNKLTPDGVTGLQYDKYGIGWRGNTDLVYKFWLEAGSYELTAGFQEFYNNAHTRTILPQVTYKEGGKNVTKKFDQFDLKSGATGARDRKVSKGVFTVPEDGEVEYRIVKAANEAPMVSWIGVKQIDLSDIVDSISGWDSYQVVRQGQKPELPESVELAFADGNKKTAAVAWDKYDENELSKVFRTQPLTIGGTIADAGDKRIEVDVQVVPSTLRYFIDCGTGDWGPTSKIFEPLKSISILGLKNETSDQRYAEGKTWGYVRTEDAGSLKLTPDGTAGESASIYNVGVRTNTGDIVYKLTLDKGTYQFTSGHHEWWDNQNRVFQPVITYALADGTEKTVEGETVTMKNNNGASVTTTIKNVEIPADNTLVTYTVKWNGKDAKPVLSFLAVEEDYFTGKTPDSITVVKKPNKLIYGLGSSIVIDGLEVTALYDGKVTENVDIDQVSVVHFDSSQEGENIPVTISYKGVETSFYVTVDREFPVYEDLALMSQTFLLKGADTANNAKLFWNPVEEAAGYRIYSVDGSEKKHLASTKAVSYDIYGMEGDTTFKVEAYDAFGQIMASSNESLAQVLTVEGNMKTWSNMPEGTLSAKAAAALKTSDDEEEEMLILDEDQEGRAAGVQYQYKIEKDDQFGTDTAKKLVEYTSADGFKAGRTVLDGNKDAALKDCKFEGVAQVTKDDQILVWAHFEKAAGYTAAELACMHGTKGGDDFTLYHERPQGNESRDMTIYRENGDMYIISSTRNNSDLNLYKLNDSWTAVLSADEYPAVTLCAGQHREAPNLVKQDGWYYLFTSEANDWFPSQGKYCAAKTLRGLAYAPLRAVHTNTFGTQSGWSSSLGGQFTLIGSRWAASGHFGEEKNWTRQFPTCFRNGYAVYQFYPEILYNDDTMIPVQDGRNLSLGQPVSTISGETAAETGFETSYLVDGNCYDTGSYYKPKSVPYTVTVDLGQLCQITHSDLTFRAVKGSDTKNPYKIYGSKDGKDFDLILDAASLNAPGFDTREIQTEDAYRYIRLNVEKVINIRNNSSASWASGIHEWTIYGDPVEQETNYESVPVGQEWLDNRGAHIQAHGGGFLQMEDEEGTIYYWVGEDKTHNKANFNGVNMYSSRDLVNWKFENKILKPDPTVPGLWDNKVERPKLIYNESTGQFILFGHWETADSYASSQICVAVSDTANGDYTYLGHWRPGGTMKNWRSQGGKSYYENDPEKKEITPDGSLSRDMTVYVDNGTAYLVSACADDHSIAIYELNDQYTDVVPGKEYHVLVHEKLEAPAIVRVGDYYYLIGSGQSGWYPNQGRYAYTTDLTDPESWSEVQWTGNNSTFYSQPTNIMTLTDPEGEHTYVYMGDRWYPSALRDSQYVWLPLEVNEGSMTMEYLPGWGLDSASGSVDIVKYKLLSENKPVEGTAGKDGRGPEKANDGDYINTKKTGDTSDCYQPESVPAYWMVDLEEEAQVSRIDISFRMYNGSEAYHQYKVYGSRDKSNWDELVDESGNTLTGFKSHELEGSYRYIKVEISKVVNSHNGSSASWGAGLVEVQVFGEAEKAENYTQKIEVTKLPDKTEYLVGEEFDPKGMEVTLTEVKGKTDSAEETEKAVKEDEESSKRTLRKAAEDEEAKDEDKASPSNAKKAAKLQSEDSSKNEDTNKDSAADSEETPGTVKRILKASEYKVDYDFGKAGKQKVEITYKGTDIYGRTRNFKDSFEVTVTDESGEPDDPDAPKDYYTTGIQVTKKPLKTSYYIGEEFDDEGMEVTATQKASGSNATRKVVLPNDELEVEYNFDKAAKESKVTVVYEEDIKGKTETFKDFFNVRVDKEEEEESWYVDRIRVSVKPKKMLYQLDEEFDPEGMRVVAVLKSSANGKGTKEENISLDELRYVYDFGEPGKKSVKVIYLGTDKKGEEKEFSTSFDVTVAQASEEGVYTDHIAITKNPDKMTYSVGDAFDKKGMEVTVYQVERETEKVTEKVTTDYQVSPGVLMSEGSCTITVSYAAEGKDGKAKVFKDSLEVQVKKGQKPEEPQKPTTSGSRNRRESNVQLNNNAGITRRDAKKGMVNSVRGIITGTDEGYSNWQRNEETGAWRLQYSDKSFAAGTYFTAEDGTRKEQVAWEMVNGAWYAFGADGYAKGGFVQDCGLGGIFYIDIERGMLTGWQLLDGKWYYFNPDSDGRKGLMMTNITTPDGYRLGADGVWIP